MVSFGFPRSVIPAVRHSIAVLSDPSIRNIKKTVRRCSLSKVVLRFLLSSFHGAHSFFDTSDAPLAPLSKSSTRLMHWLALRRRPPAQCSGLCRLPTPPIRLLALDIPFIARIQIRRAVRMRLDRLARVRRAGTRITMPATMG